MFKCNIGLGKPVIVPLIVKNGKLMFQIMSKIYRERDLFYLFEHLLCQIFKSKQVKTVWLQ